MEAVCIILGLNPPVFRQKNHQGRVGLGSLQEGTLNDPKFLSNLIKFDKENILQKIIDKVSPYMKPGLSGNREACFQLLLTGSAAGYGRDVYDKVAKVVRPKRESLKKAGST